jgi:hypothetical protein
MEAVIALTHCTDAISQAGENGSALQLLSNGDGHLDSRGGSSSSFAVGLFTLSRRRFLVGCPKM